MITESLEASKNNFIFTAETTPSVSTNLNENVDRHPLQFDAFLRSKN